MIRFRHRGDFKNTERLLRSAKNINYRLILEKYARQGIQALASVTPKDSGVTSDSWGYEISPSKSGFKLSWTNSSVNEGVPIVILLQYGHGTRSGTYVQGRDFINPAMRPLFETIAENIWKEVTGS